MDYDAYDIAAVYDRARALVPATAKLWRALLAETIDPGAAPMIVDLGCGTGRFSELLAHQFGGQVIGIDPSAKMVQQARRTPSPGDISYRQGSGEALPLPDGCADLVFMSMVYHHLADPGAAAQECHRILREGGHVSIRNASREADFPHRRFFPLQALIDSELPARAEVLATFERAGFACLTHRVVTQVTAADWPGFVEKSALRGDSFLARLTDAQFRTGMDALRAYADGADISGPVTEEIDWFVFARRGSGDASRTIGSRR